MLDFVVLLRKLPSAICTSCTHSGTGACFFACLFCTYICNVHFFFVPLYPERSAGARRASRPQETYDTTVNDARQQHPRPT